MASIPPTTVLHSITEIRYVTAEAEQLVTCPLFYSSFAMLRGNNVTLLRHIHTIVRNSEIQDPQTPHTLGSVDRQMVLNVLFPLSQVPSYYSSTHTPILQPKVSVGKRRVLALALETRQKHSVGLPSISVARSLHALWEERDHTAPPGL
jgi:hypothetical protein